LKVPYGLPSIVFAVATSSLNVARPEPMWMMSFDQTGPHRTSLLLK
jgi:hypothetical protein